MIIQKEQDFKDQARYSYASRVSEVVNIQFPVASNMTWDGYWRQIYNKANTVIQRQANELAQRGNITYEEGRQLSEVQRNALILEIRRKLSPFGRFYSEKIKPSKNLPTFDNLLEKKGSVEAVLLSVGKTRAVTNRIAFIGRSLGVAGIAVEIVAVGVVIEKAPPKERARVATEEISGAVGGLVGGTGGMWGGAVAGAVWAGAWAAPTLAIPVVGAISEGGAILLGGLIGGVFAGWISHSASKAAANKIWNLTIQWK